MNPRAQALARGLHEPQELNAFPAESQPAAVHHGPHKPLEDETVELALAHGAQGLQDLPPDGLEAAEAHDSAHRRIARLFDVTRHTTFRLNSLPDFP
jgi:hypothetical protein